MELKPWVWPWATIMSCLEEAGELLQLGRADWDDLVVEGDNFYTDRRVVDLVNPVLAAQSATSRTLQMCVQLVKPGETAEAHRHTFNALRFVVESKGVYTTVEGEEILMEPGDLCLTPNWTWHDHTNPTDEPAIWLDLLDSRLSKHVVDVILKDIWAEGPTQTVSKPPGYYGQRAGAVRPRTVNVGNQAGPSVQGVPYMYKWADTLKSLQEMSAAGESDPYDGVLLEYTNPVNGGPTTPTTSCRIQMLRPGEVTRSHRHTGIGVYHVVQGQGITTVGARDKRVFTGGPAGASENESEELAWGERDCFFVPSWRWHHHRNLSKSEPAILFSLNDRPAIEALGFYMEQGS